MEEAQDLIGIGHVANPCVPGRVGQSIAEPREDEGHHQDRIGGMEAIDHICDEMASRGQYGDSSLTKGAVDAMVQQRRQDVSRQRGQKHQGNDGVGEAVKGFQLSWSDICLSFGMEGPSVHRGSRPTSISINTPKLYIELQRHTP